MPVRNGAPTTDAVLRLRLLGGFSAAVDGEPVADGWRLRKAKTLVKLLALAPGHRLHRLALVNLLWPELDPAASTNNFHQTLHAARRVVGASAILLRDDVVALGPVRVDAEEFEAAASSALAGGTTDELQAAVALYPGELLPEDTYAEWATVARERLADTCAALTLQLGVALISAGSGEEAVAVLEPLAAQRPIDEPLQRHLMSALAAAGRRWDALAVYERLRTTLGEELAAAPDPDSKLLYRRLLGTGAGTPSGAHNLPAATTTFVGRHRELGELTACLDRTRLLTLVGPGGAGKSRLALELARRRLDQAPADGAWLVELAGLADGSLAPSAIATALRLDMSGDRPSAAALVSQLGERQVLIVLDNCEHLLGDVVPLVGELLARCPGVTMVATSRETLGVAGEVTWRVPSLELPGTDADGDSDTLARREAVQLFLERARDASPSFRLDATTAPAVVRICHRLDGMPLALELAAARLAHLSVGQLADRLGDALTLLAHRRRGGHDGLDRQQTLAATLDWSHDLLDEEEQTVFRRLAVFAVGFDLEAADRVCAVDDVLGVVGRLVDKSLVGADTSGEQARYRLLEVVRQYAESRLVYAGEIAGCRRRHRDWFVARAAVHDPDRGEPVVGEPSGWFDVERDNLRAALGSALSEDPASSLALATGTWRFWVSRGQIAEGARWLSLALSACPERSLVRARALFATGVLDIRQGRIEPLETLGDDIVDLLKELGDGAELAHGRHQRALFVFMAGDWARAALLSDETLAAARSLPTVLATGQHFAGVLALSRGDIVGARELFGSAFETMADIPDTVAPFFTGLTIGWVVDERGDLPMPYAEDSVVLGRRVGTAQGRAHTVASMALTERLLGDCDSALSLLDDAIARFRAIDDAYGEGYATAQRGHTQRWAGNYAGARASFGRAESLRRSLRDQRSIALTLSGRALVEAAAGHGGPARRLARDALDMMTATGDRPGMTLAGHDLALVDVLLGELPAARLLLERTVAQPLVPGTHRAVAWEQLLLAGVLERLGEDRAAAAARAAAGQTFTRLGEQRGIAAVLRAGKVRARTVPANRAPREGT